MTNRAEKREDHNICFASFKSVTGKNRIILLFVRFIILSGGLEPSEKRRRVLTGLFGYCGVDMRAVLGAPVDKNLLRYDVLLVESQKDLGNLGQQLRMFDTSQVLDSAEEGHLPTLCGDHLTEK